MQKYSKLLFIVLAIAVFVSVLYLLFFRNRSFDKTSNNGVEEVITKTDGSSFILEKDQKSIDHSVSYFEKDFSKSIIDLKFSILPNPVPTAITLVLKYDPDYIEVTKVESGNLWGGSNILQNKIFHKEGRVDFSLGQGFDSKPTGSNTIARLNVTNKTDKSSYNIKIEDGSVMAFVGVNNLIKLESSDVMVILEQ